MDGPAFSSFFYDTRTNQPDTPFAMQLSKWFVILIPVLLEEQPMKIR
jgi:hypothetical protein